MQTRISAIGLLIAGFSLALAHQVALASRQEAAGELSIATGLRGPGQSLEQNRPFSAALERAMLLDGQLRSAWLVKLRGQDVGVASVSPETARAQLQAHFVVVEQILRANTPRSLDVAIARLEAARGRPFTTVERLLVREHLAAQRARQIARLAEYRQRGRFPLNESYPGRVLPIFVDAHDTACAVGYLMRQSGWREAVAQVQGSNNLVYVPEVASGPVHDWILQSGLTQEEAALVQPAYEFERYALQEFDEQPNSWSFSLTNTSGDAALVEPDGPFGGYLGLTQLSANSHNSIAFDQVTNRSVTQSLRLEFAFRASDDAANLAAGGCCDEAGDGFGIGWFDVATYGSSGPVNPGALVAGRQWEDPSAGPGFSNALVIGFDFFEDGQADGNHIRIAYNGSDNVLYEQIVPFAMNDNDIQFVYVDLYNDGADSYLNLDLVENFPQGGLHTASFPIPGLDLNEFAQSTRIIAGGRTGSAYSEVDILYAGYVISAPEPGSLFLAALGVGGLGLLIWRRRRRVERQS